MQRRMGVVPSTGALITPRPPLCAERGEAAANYYAARQRIERVKRWSEDADGEFIEAEAKMDGYA
jgi:hypothetical protein